jgi:hypothetical protein
VKLAGGVEIARPDPERRRHVCVVPDITPQRRQIGEQIGAGR